MKKQKFILLILFSLLLFLVKAQTIITLEKTLDMASKGSPRLQSSLFNLDRTTETLNAKRAALKSPEVVADKLGHVKFKFYMCDRPASLDIRVSGMGVPSGFPGEGYSTAEVKVTKQ